MADSDQTTIPNPNPNPNLNEDQEQQQQSLSKRAQKKLRKKQWMEDKKSQKRAAEKERKAAERDRRRLEWEEQLAAAGSEEERNKLIDVKREGKRERVGRQAEERRIKIERLKKAVESGQKVVLDLEFEGLMSASEISSLSQQIMYCYAANGRSKNPVHLLLTGCKGEMESQLQKIPGINNWIITKKPESYIEHFEGQIENLVYLTADSENVLEELDLKSVYVIGGLVDRNRHKGITMEKAIKQGIKSAKLPIGNYLKMSSSQVLTVNQVFEIMLNFVETKDWKTAFFKTIPQRKRGDSEIDISGEGNNGNEINELIGSEEIEERDLKEEESCLRKKQCIREGENGEKGEIGEERIEMNENGSKEDLS
ncbi:hypothetical protein LUZ60_000099 [Juncus effusus]|nr:hypothetical protein LUZ60_000099 [Juncus effusus]